MANPTTNYGFVLPTATDLVTDLPADFDVALQGVDTRLKALQPGTTLGDIAYSSATANTNTRLPIGTNGQVLGVVAGVPAWTTDSAGMTNPMTTTGDTIYSSSGSTPARLGIGTAGQVLQVNSGATAPEWATASSGGMTSLATGTLSGSVLTLSSISGSYNRLQLWLVKPLPATDSATLTFKINNSSGNNYLGSNASVNSGGPFQYTSTPLGTQMDNGTSDSFIIIDLPNYAGTTWKIINTEVVTNNPTTPADCNFKKDFTFANITSAITRIDVSPSSGNWTSGSYTLYGVK